MGIPVLPPDVNRSEWAFTVTSEGIRYGLGAVKGAGEAAIASVIEARAAGPIRSLFTLCERLDLRLVNRRVLESLVKAGALDSLGLTNGERVALPSLRARLFAAIERACEHGSRSQRDRDQGQAQLFGGSADEDGEVAGRGLEWALPEVPPWTEPQQLAGEKEVLGLYLSGHPVERFARELKTLGARTTAELSYPNGDSGAAAGEVSIGGVISNCRPLRTRKGDRMAVFTLEDPHGSTEVVAFPEAFGRAQGLIQSDTMVFVRGRLERDEESPRIFASEIVALEAVRERAAREVAIRLTVPPHDRRTFEALADLFERHRGDRRVCFEVELTSSGAPLRVRADVNMQVRVKPSDQLFAEVERICGRGSVSLR
jgi:DNA polymerase-3 subunit alpha